MSNWRDASGRKTGSTRYWRKLRQSIVREYGLRCHLCGGTIDERYRTPHRLSLEIHHVMGGLAGPFDRRYLRPVHRGCNAAVGNPHPVLPNGMPYDPEPAPSNSYKPWYGQSTTGDPPGRSLDDWLSDPPPKPPLTKW